jgi:MYND finger
MTTATPTIENPLQNSPSAIEWVQTLELGYDEPEPFQTVCFSCRKLPSDEPSHTASSSSEDVDMHENEAPTMTTKKPLLKCAKCHVASYCSRECQIKDWKGGHKRACTSYGRLVTFSTDDEDANATVRATIRSELFHRIRFYACPYAVHKTRTLGRGFLFVQSDTTLRDLSLAIPKDVTGRDLPHGRAILMHFLTMGEYDAEVCRDDFELAMVRSKLQELVTAYDEFKEVVFLWKLRCGHVALGKAVLVPDYPICKQLGEAYYSDNLAGAVQLNLDDL